MLNGVIKVLVLGVEKSRQIQSLIESGENIGAIKCREGAKSFLDRCSSGRREVFPLPDTPMATEAEALSLYTTEMQHTR